MPETGNAGESGLEGTPARIDTCRVPSPLRFGLFLAAMFGALAAVALALAHAEPAIVNPGSGALLTSPPAEVDIVMSQEVSRGEQTGIDVVDANGVEVTTVDAVVDNGDRRRVTVSLPTDLAPGVYTVRWKTLSAEDGDTDSGEYQFTYDPAGVANPGTQQVRQDPLSPEETATAPTDSSPRPPLLGGDGGSGTSWVLVAAVGVGMLILGSGVTFLLIQKRQ